MTQYVVHQVASVSDLERSWAFYEAALAAGGRNHGPPGLRPQYHAGYYAAFVLDPVGKNIEAVFHDRT